MKCINIFCWLAFPYLFFVPLFLSSAKALELEEEQLIENSYEEIRLLAHRLVSEFPPPGHLYVGVGRSPTPLIAFLQAIDSEAAINFPLSDLKYYGDPFDMDEASFKILHQHFENFFGSYRKKGKAIVFIDYIISGTTLFRLQQYYQSLRKKDKTWPLSLSVGLSVADIDIPIAFHSSHLPVPQMLRLGVSLKESILDSEWKHMAEYEKTSLTTLSKHPPLKTSPHAYRTLKIRLRAKQKKDASAEFLEILQKLSLNNSSGTCARLMKSLLFRLNIRHR